MALKEKLSKSQKENSKEVDSPKETADISIENPSIEETARQSDDVPEKISSDDSAIYVEVNGKWVDSSDAGLGFEITGVKSNRGVVKVQTANGWFDETDPKKLPILFLETPGFGISVSVHVKGGEWLPIQEDKGGCGVAIDGISFFEK